MVTSRYLSVFSKFPLGFLLSLCYLTVSICTTFCYILFIFSNHTPPNDTHAPISFSNFVEIWGNIYGGILEYGIHTDKQHGSLNDVH